MGVVYVSYTEIPDKYAEFSFKTRALLDERPNVSTINEDNSLKGSISISAASDAIVEKLTETADYNKYFSDCNFNKEKQEVREFTRKMALSLYIKFTLKGGYALSSEVAVAHITSEGLGIRLDSANNSQQNWVE